MLLPFSVFILFSCRFHVITEKITVSLSCAKRNLEKWVVTGVQCSASKLKGGVLSTRGAMVTGDTLCYIPGASAERGNQGHRVSTICSSCFSTPRDFLCRPESRKLFFPFSISKENYLKFLNLLDRLFINTKWENRCKIVLRNRSQHTNISQSVCHETVLLEIVIGVKQ